MGKYFKYAIGEIILVVIGILIALQINNWNEERKQSEKRDSYYLSMIGSFEKDLQKIDSYEKYLEGIQNNVNEFRINVKKSSNYLKASQYIDSLNIFTSDLDLNASIWESIVNSGHIELMDESIKSSLLEFWNSYNDYKEANYANSQHYWDLIKSILLTNSSNYALKVVKENEVLSLKAEKARNHMEEVNTVLVAIGFREVGNRGSQFRMKQFKNEIKKIISDMRNKLDN
jgi:hypothetical protein